MGGRGVMSGHTDGWETCDSRIVEVSTQNSTACWSFERNLSNIFVFALKKLRSKMEVTVIDLITNATLIQTGSGHWSQWSLSLKTEGHKH